MKKPTGKLGIQNRRVSFVETRQVSEKDCFPSVSYDYVDMATKTDSYKCTRVVNQHMLGQQLGHCLWSFVKARRELYIMLVEIIMNGGVPIAFSSMISETFYLMPSNVFP